MNHLATALVRQLMRDRSSSESANHRHPPRAKASVSEEQVIRLRELKAQGWICRDARVAVMPDVSESYAASIWAGARRSKEA